jgi:hypothetical protein
MLTFENSQHLGATGIMEKLIVSSMPPDLHGSCPIASPWP